ncbi:hypothetical protein ACFQL1_15995 [Halomicroarcula sp. GCM10025709]|uniref:hypothetical protein n=1 Tax=Haloarcula TaxID=2237 RepID=UPI0024C3ACB8|nr:hypothetical protein [Halomicroarcula sp. YJ-61-S]
MSTYQTPTQERTDTDDRIEGPIPEFDKFGQHTGEHFYRCTDCRAEAMRERDLADCCGGAA